MKVEYEALKSAYAELVLEINTLRTEKVTKSKVTVKNADGSSREEEHFNSVFEEDQKIINQMKISSQQQEISRLQSQLHEYRKEESG